MKILLLGEYSNVHATLSEGLQELGHQVTVASNGDFWKNYPRDIDLKREKGFYGTLCFLARVTKAISQFQGYDIVQLINPLFIETKANKLLPLYRFLRRHNRHIVLGAFGMDYYWVNTCVTRKQLRYSDFNFGDELRTDENAMKERADWIGTDKERLNRTIADDCDAIVAGLYEYWTCYQPSFPRKTKFIPYPIKHIAQAGDIPSEAHTPLRLFIGINKSRSTYKGTDIMLRAAQDLQARYPDKVQLRIAENVPFSEYKEMITHADAILDQLYSYTPAMNALGAMAQGIICVGGGEPENYDILNEHTLHPIINVQPNYESVYHQLQYLVLHPHLVPQLKRQSIEYIRTHHHYLKVALSYDECYRSLLSTDTLAENAGTYTYKG